MTEVQNIKKIRFRLILIILILIPLGFAAKFYTGRGEHLLSDKIAGSLYVIFWSQLAINIFIHKNHYKILALVFLITCTLEFLQLYTSPFLLSVRSTFAGRSLIGSSFAWSDFVFYFTGTVVSWLIIQLLQKDK